MAKDESRGCRVGVRGGKLFTELIFLHLRLQHQFLHSLLLILNILLKYSAGIPQAAAGSNI